MGARVALTLAVSAILVAFVCAASCNEPVDASGRPVDVGRFRLRTFPTGAKVWIDGELKVEATPATLFLAPGEHTLRMQLEGAEAVERTVRISAGDVVDRTYDVPKPPDATISVRSDQEGASVRINGYPRGKTPLTKTIVRPGPIDLTVVSIDGRARAWRGKLGIAEQKDLEILFDPPMSTPDEGPEHAHMTDAPLEGQLTLGLSPDGEVYDGEDEHLIGRAPLQATTFQAGEHHLVLRSLDGKYEKHVRVEVRANQLSVYRFYLGIQDQIR
ncbi:MAG: PEGA domain-containing protein [Deltaproteobacteria bacterium]|nr:PEGA domain-containing protein [Deltaproteobacteria bacterium]